MNKDEKILQALEALQADVVTMKHDLKSVKEDVKAVDLKVDTAHEFYLMHE